MKETIQRLYLFAHNTVTRAIGLVFFLIGLLVVSSSFVPSDGEAALIFGIGSLCVLLGGYALVFPQKVTYARSGHRDDDDDDSLGSSGLGPNSRNRRRGRP